MTGPKEEMEGIPMFAPPILEKPGGFRLSQTPAICKFIGTQLGYRPKPSDPVTEAQTDAINLTIHDYLRELFDVNPSDKEETNGRSK